MPCLKGDTQNAVISYFESPLSQSEIESSMEFASTMISTLFKLIKIRIFLPAANDYAGSVSTPTGLEIALLTFTMIILRSFELFMTKLVSNRYRFVAILGLFIGLTSLYTNCSKEGLQPLNEAVVGVYNYGTVTANYCTTPPVQAQQNIKYLFVLDHSQSNQPVVQPVPGDASDTDPTGSRRYGPLIYFVNSLPVSPFINYSFDIIDFNDTAAQVAGLSTFDNSASDFVNNYATIDWEGNGNATLPAPKDGGYTDFINALEAASNLITTDLNAISAVPEPFIIANSYQIIFVTDGIPTILSGAGLATECFDATNLGNPANTSGCTVPSGASDIKTIIDTQINNLKNDPRLGKYVGNITLNTAFYYNATDPAPLLTQARALLQAMATEGNGVYVEFGSTPVSYAQFTPPQLVLQNQIADVFVENENAVWWDNGELMQDSDGDGLPDLIEMQTGSNPYVKDTDGNGVSDYVEYRSKGKPCNDAKCLPANRDPYPICAGYSPVTDASGNVTFQSSTNDGLNDCEKYVSGGTPGQYSSPDDIIPDFLALKNTIQIQPGNPNVALADPFGDGVQNYYKLKLGLPIQVSDKELLDFKQRQSVVYAISSSDPSLSCYQLYVSNVALTAPNNKIKVSVIQNSGAFQDKPFLMTAEGVVDDNFNVVFQPTDFK